jgi:hypothetical protein
LWGFIPTINQSSTAGYTAVLINPTETTTGSGIKNLLDMQVGGVSRSRIDNTGTHVLSSLASLINYNTADETTNYERVREYWSSNVFNIFSEAGGSGVGRDIKIIAGGSALHVQAASGLIARRDNTAFVGTGILAVASTGLTGSGGIQQGLSITPNMNQSGTAGYTMLLVNPTESATGSGAKLLADFQVGGVSKFSVNNAGVEFHANVASAPATPTGGGVIYVEAGALKYKGSSGTVTVLGAA